MNLRYQLAFVLLLYWQSTPPCVQATSVTNIGIACPVNGTAVFSWSYRLGQGQAINRIEWARIAPTSALLLEVDRNGNPTAYDSRASTNGSAILILTNATSNDLGTYRCTVRVMGSNVVYEDEADLKLLKYPDEFVRGVTMSATVKEDEHKSVVVKFDEVPANDTCLDITYHIEYKRRSGSWEPAGSVEGSAYGNTTLNFTVTGLEPGESYKFGVKAENPLRVSLNRAESDTWILIEDLLKAFLSLPPLVAFVVLALLAAIFMIAILVAEKCVTCTCDMVKLVACVGPAVEAVLAAIVIIMAAVSHINEQGFITIVILSAVAAVMSIVAAVAGFLFQKCCKRVNFPVVTMALLFILGLMVAIAGIVISVLRIQEQRTKAAGLGVGIASIIVLFAAFIWFLCRVCCGNRQSSQVSQDLSEARSQNQVELEQQLPQAEEKTAKPAQTPANEKEGI